MITRVNFCVSLKDYVYKNYTGSSNISLGVIECIPKPYDELVKIFGENTRGLLVTPQGTTRYMQKVFEDSAPVYIDSIMSETTAVDEGDSDHGWPIEAFYIKNTSNPKIALQLKE